MLPGSNLWAVVFFIMLVSVGIDSVFGSVEMVTNFMLSEFKLATQSKRTVVFVYLFALFIFSFLFSTQSAIYMFALFDHFAIGLGLLFLLLAETIVFAWFFDLQSLNYLMENITGESFTIF